MDQNPPVQPNNITPQATPLPVPASLPMTGQAVSMRIPTVQPQPAKSTVATASQTIPTQSALPKVGETTSAELSSTKAPQASLEPSTSSTPTAQPTASTSDKKSTKRKKEKLPKDVPNIRLDEGINLLPTMSVEEIQVEQRKVGFNLFAAVTILVLVLISIAIIGFNIVTKVIRNNEQKQLNTLEQELRSETNTIEANNAIIKRVNLYQDVQESTFSPKEVMLYWQDLTQEYGDFQSFELTGGLEFSISGSTENITEVSKLWHRLSIDEKIETVVLSEVSTGEGGTPYSFEGKLNFDYFANQQNGSN